MPDHRSAELELDRYLNDLASGQTGNGDYDLESGATKAVRLARALAASPLPQPSYEHVGSDVMTEIARLNAEAKSAGEMTEPAALALRQAMYSANGRAGTGPNALAPAVPVPRQERWAASQLATAAVILFTLVASYVVLSLTYRGSGEQFVGVPVVAPPAVGEPVEFVWQTKGGPDLSLQDPYHLAIDPEGNLWVADGDNGRFQIFAPDGTYLETWGERGSGEGQFNFVNPLFGGSGGGAAAFDAAGNLYVADVGNYRIQKFDPDRQFLTSWGEEGRANGQFGAPYDLAVDKSGRIYVVDAGRSDVQVFDDEGRFLTKWGSSGQAPGEFNSPTGVTVAPDGSLWIADNGNNRVQQFAADGTIGEVWGAAGAAKAALHYPDDLAVDGQGRVFVTDSANARVQIFSQDGQYLAGWGSPGAGADQLRWPTGIVLDGTGNVYVAEQDSDRIQKFRLMPVGLPAVLVEDANLELPADPVELVWSTNESPDQIPLADPYHLDIDPAGNLWAPDPWANRFHIYSPEGTLVRTWGSRGNGEGEFNFLNLGKWYGGSAGAAAFDRQGNLFVADPGNYRIQKFDPDLNFLHAWGSDGEADGQFAALNDLAVDDHGRVYTVDAETALVQVFDNDGRFLLKWGGEGTQEGAFLTPLGLTIDNAGNVLVADSYNHRIQKFSPEGRFLTAWGGVGSELGQLNLPDDVAVDRQGRVFVSDWTNNRVQVFDPEGRFLASWGEGGADPGDVHGPMGIALDDAGSIYVSESDNDRIQKFRLNPAPGT